MTDQPKPSNSSRPDWHPHFRDAIWMLSDAYTWGDPIPEQLLRWVLEYHPWKVDRTHDSTESVGGSASGSGVEGLNRPRG